MTRVQIGMSATVEADARIYTGKVYHVRENGWACVECPDGHIASGPVIFFAS